jgi:hypothetical protein
MDPKIPVTQKSKDRTRPQIPASPQQWRVAVCVESVTFCAGVKEVLEVLDVFLVAERRSAMERCFSFLCGSPA